jgi:hypothetical protein
LRLCWPVAFPSPAVACRATGITAKLNAAAAGEHDKARKYLEMTVLFAIARDRAAFDHKGAANRQAFRKTAELVT